MVEDAAKLRAISDSNYLKRYENIFEEIKRMMRERALNGFYNYECKFFYEELGERNECEGVWKNTPFQSFVSWLKENKFEVRVSETVKAFFVVGFCIEIWWDKAEFYES